MPLIQTIPLTQQKDPLMHLHGTMKDAQDLLLTKTYFEYPDGQLFCKKKEQNLRVYRMETQGGLSSFMSIGGPLLRMMMLPFVDITTDSSQSRLVLKSQFHPISHVLRLSPAICIFFCLWFLMEVLGPSSLKHSAPIIVSAIYVLLILFLNHRKCVHLIHVVTHHIHREVLS